MNLNQQPGGNKEVLSIQQRLEQRNKEFKIRVVKSNPQIGQITIDEFYSLDPERQGSNTCAAAAWVILMSFEGKFTKQQFIKELCEEESDLARATATVDNLIKTGLAEIKNGRVYLNMEMVQG